MTYKIVSKYIKEYPSKYQHAKAYFLLEKKYKDFLVNFDIKKPKD